VHRSLTLQRGACCVSFAAKESGCVVVRCCLLFFVVVYRLYFVKHTLAICDQCAYQNENSNEQSDCNPEPHQKPNRESLQRHPNKHQRPSNTNHAKGTTHVCGVCVCVTSVCCTDRKGSVSKTAKHNSYTLPTASCHEHQHFKCTSPTTNHHKRLLHVRFSSKQQIKTAPVKCRCTCCVPA
jgi:hypothetical protein